MNERRTELEQEYRRAIYAVTGETKEIRFRIGEFSPEIDALLASRNAGSFAFITAHNPRSKVLTAAENELRHAELKNLLIAGSFKFLEGYSTDTDGKWGRETSVLVLDISAEKACETAKKFEQNAIVCGARNEKTHLVWIS